MKNIAIILSGGVGSRMNLDTPKQYILVNGKPVFSYCLKTFFENACVDAVVIVVANEWKNFVESQVASISCPKPVFYAEPGETRQYSILNALIVTRNLFEGEEKNVIIHDAARPLVSMDLINRCLEGCREADAVMPVVPVKDTMYFSEDGKQIHSLLDRKCLWAGQAPEAFKFEKYLEAHESMSREELLKINGSTELAVRANLKCVMIPGDPMNFKITTPEDLTNFKSIVSQGLL